MSLRVILKVYLKLFFTFENIFESLIKAFFFNFQLFFKICSKLFFKILIILQMYPLRVLFKTFNTQFHQIKKLGSALTDKLIKLISNCINFISIKSPTAFNPLLLGILLSTRVRTIVMNKIKSLRVHIRLQIGIKKLHLKKCQIFPIATKCFYDEDINVSDLINIFYPQKSFLIAECLRQLLALVSALLLSLLFLLPWRSLKSN